MRSQPDQWPLPRDLVQRSEKSIQCPQPVLGSTQALLHRQHGGCRERPHRAPAQFDAAMTALGQRHDLFLHQEETPPARCPPQHRAHPRHPVDVPRDQMAAEAPVRRHRALQVDGVAGTQAAGGRLICNSKEP